MRKQNETLPAEILFLHGYARQTVINLAYSREKVQCLTTPIKLWRYHQERVIMLENRLFSIEQQIENFLNDFILCRNGITRI